MAGSERRDATHTTANGSQGALRPCRLTSSRPPTYMEDVFLIDSEGEESVQPGRRDSGDDADGSQRPEKRPRREASVHAVGESESEASTSLELTTKKARGKGRSKLESNFGVLLDGETARSEHEDEADLLDGEDAIQLVGLIEDDLVNVAVAYDFLSPPQSNVFCTIVPPASTSPLNPPADVVAERDGVEMVPAFPFEEKLPSVGDRIEVTMGREQHEHSIALDKFNAVPLSRATGDKGKRGCLLNVGSHVYSTDWSPKGRARVQAEDSEYLCVSAALDAWPRTAGLSRNTTPTPGALQIWSVSSDEAWGATMEMLLCLDGGRVASVRWNPLQRTFGGINEWLGLLAVARHDGRVDVYAVPHPDAVEQRLDNDSSAHARDPSDPICIAPRPLCRLRVERGAPLCMDWLDVDRLVVGYSNGWLATWSLSGALRTPAQCPARPLMYVRVSRTALSDVAWNAAGTLIYSSAFDGSIYATTMVLPDFSTALVHSRDSSTALAYQRHVDAPVYERLEDNGVRIIDFTAERISSRQLYLHCGRICALATSAYHPFVASGGADGTVRTANAPLLLHRKRRWSGAGSATLFRLDVPDRTTGQLRFIDHIQAHPLTRTTPTEVSTNESSTAKGGRVFVTMAWHPAACVTEVRWNRNYAREAWLASGMAAGLVRVDVVGDD